MTRIDADVKLLDVNKLIPYEKNNKKHGKRQIKLLADHIQEVGFDQPIVVDENMIILKGHGRLEAAKKLKLEKVPVLIKEGLSEAQKKAARIADNKLADLAEYDNEALQSELEELAEMDFDVALIGLEVSADEFEFDPPDENEPNVQTKTALRVDTDSVEACRELLQELLDRGLKVKVI